MNCNEIEQTGVVSQWQLSTLVSVALTLAVSPTVLQQVKYYLLRNPLQNDQAIILKFWYKILSNNWPIL